MMLNTFSDVALSEQPELEPGDEQPPFDTAEAARDILRKHGFQYTRTSDDSEGDTCSLQFWERDGVGDGHIAVFLGSPVRRVSLEIDGVEVAAYCTPTRLAAFDIAVRALLEHTRC